jgi:hypothetical protein
VILFSFSLSLDACLPVGRGEGGGGGEGENEIVSILTKRKKEVKKKCIVYLRLAVAESMALKNISKSFSKEDRT